MSFASWAAALLLFAGGQATPAPSPSPPTPPAATAEAPAAQLASERDPAALALVKKMSDRLRGARTMTFRARVALELPVAGGALASFVNGAHVAVRRPDGLAVRRSGDLPEFRFAYDGKAMTAFSPGAGSWGTTAAPPTLDAMLFAAAEQGGLSFPSDEILVTDPFAAITKGATQVAGLGPSTVDGKKTEHILVVSPGLQLELWIDPATALPARVAVVYTDHPRSPHFSSEYFDWQLDRELPASTFALPKPAGVAQVEFRDACSAFR